MPDLTCREFIQFLDEYISGAQPADVRSRFESHLEACQHCRDYLRTYRQTVELARAACGKSDDDPPADVPHELLRAVLDAVAGQP